MTHLIGAVKYAKNLGISGHVAAALVIGRRGMNFTETLSPSDLEKGACVPVSNGGFVTFPLLADGGKHVGPPDWPEVAGRLRAARMRYYQSGVWKRNPEPLSVRTAAGAGPRKNMPARPAPAPQGR